MRDDHVASRRTGVACIALATTMLWQRPARADCDCEDDFEPRILDGHQFVPSSVVGWAFIDSNIATTTTLGAAHFDVEPSGPLAAAARLNSPREVRLVTIGQTLSGAAALTPWLGISGALSGAGALPRDVLSAALIGVDEALGLEVGVGLVLVKLRNVQITARGDFGFTNNRALQPNAPLGSIFTTDRSETLRPALIAAIAASPVLGFQASFSYMWQWFNTSEADVTRTISGGAAATVNFGPAPATLLVGIGVNHDSGAPLDVHNLRAVLGSGGTPVLGELGLYYTGRRDLDLGVVVSYQFTGDDDDRRVVGNLRLGYYF